MKKIIRKFWGVAFILVLLSTLLIGAVPQATAADYAFAADNTQPSANNRVLAPAAGWGAIDMVQVGNTILITGKAGAGGANSIYRSTDGGVTWAPLTAAGLPAANAYFGFVAMAPDNTNIIAVVNTQVMPNIIYLSNNGGNSFTAITATAGWVKGIAISPVLNGTNRMTIVGNTQGPNAGATAFTGFVNTWQIGSVSPAWAAVAGTGVPLRQDFCGVTYSTNFNADQAMLVVSHNSTYSDITNAHLDARGLTQLHVYSFNTNTWDALVDITYPRTLYTGAATADTNGNGLSDNVTAGSAKFALDPNFYMGDSAAQIGFFVVNISSNATGAVAAVGGLYRLNASTTTAIKASMAFNGVAWDGTNVMASQNGTFNAITSGTPIWRCANALTSSPSVLVNTTNKAPATGNNTRLFFAGGVGYAVSSGANGGVAKTTDYGKSWNGFRLLNTTFALINDFWISPDGSRSYYITDDGVDINLWRKSGSTWERVFIIPAGVGQLWMVRADADVPDTVFLGRAAAVNMWKSLDGGEYTWSPRACSAAIKDFAVQDADILYVAVNAATTMIKSTQGAFTWNSATQTGFATLAGGNTCHSITLIGDNQVLIGGTAGGVAYTADGATWSTIPRNLLVGGAVVVTANGLATGNVIWAASAAGAANSVASWTLGTNNAGTGWTAAGVAPGSGDGICLANGVLYVWDNTTPRLIRFLRPAITMSAPNQDTLNVGALAFLAAQTVNALQVYTTGEVNTVVARDAAATDTAQGYSDFLATATNVPAPIYPINNAIIPINSISGIINAFVFQWNAPPALSTVVGYSFDLQVYLDAAGTIIVGNNAAANAVLNGGTVSAAGSGLGVGGAALAMQPGTTYYWRVRTSAGLPVLSNWSAMQTFVVQQLTAIVPVIASPANGGEVNTQSPAFSWSPIANATSYTFELALDADFTNVVYTVDPTSAGASLPSTIKLTRGLQYFWRVKTLTPMDGEWSAVSNFIVAELPPVTPTTPQVTITTAPQPTIIISQPPVTTTQTQIVVPPPEVNEVNPSYIWAIIIVGAVLVIAVIVLIVRTRRSV